MQIDRILYPVQSLGPGKRIVIWTIGCYKRCPNCASPELWKFDKKKDISVKQILKLVASIDEQVDGITITGGEPFCQIEELSILLDEIRKKTKDILIFTGYTLEEIDNNDSIKNCIKKAALVISGEYIDSLNDNQTALIASGNQKIIWCNEKYKELYMDYIKNGRIIENFYYENNLISVGIHNNDEVRKENSL